MANFGGFKFEPVPMIPESQEPLNRWTNTDGRRCEICNMPWAGDGMLESKYEGPYAACVGGFVRPMDEVSQDRAKAPQWDGKTLRKGTRQCPQWRASSLGASNPVAEYQPPPKKATLLESEQARVKGEVDAWIRRFMDASGKVGGVAIQGPTGVGKTMILRDYLLPKIRREGYSAELYTALELHQCLADNYNNNPGIVVDSLTSWRLLIIDDLGAEPPNQPEHMRAIIEGLYNHCESPSAETVVIFTTNLTGKDIEARYGARALDRISGHCSKRIGGMMFKFDPSTPSFRRV
jgi:hypothetical protein